MNFSIKKLLILPFIFISFSAPIFLYAETVNVDASKLLSHTDISFSPRFGSFEEDSVFQVSILVNTRGKSINGIEVRINFDKDRLSIINQTGGTSIIGVWVEPPRYDNTRGTASYVGVIPGGIITEAGLVGTITFKAKSAGQAVVSTASNSKILLNDGLGTETIVGLGRANYTILTKAPGGVQIFSETHPIQSDWYNNNSPTLSWIRDPGVAGFSFELDNKPNTIPDNIADGDETTKSFENLTDGLWYFHIKGSRNNVWSTTGNFLLRIDTAPPAEFKPEVNYLVAAVVETERVLVSFFTTDNLSGIDHYEVGIIDKDQPPTESPAFVQAESPFQVPLSAGGRLEVVVRALDRAGNARDESIDVKVPSSITKFIQDYLVYILIGIILLGLIILILHYLVGHHIIRSIRRVRQMLAKEEVAEEEKMFPQTDDIPQNGEKVGDMEKPLSENNDNPNNYIDSIH